jgi:hypothetical protein
MSLSLHSTCGALIFIFSLLVPSQAAFADGKTSGSPKAKEQTGQQGGESAKAIEKRRDPSRHHTPDRNAQMTFSGAKYYVVGPIKKIEDDYFYVRDEELNEDVRLVMDEGSKVICTYTTSEGTVRDCVLSVGDRVKAEVSDLGAVTTIRALPPEEKLTSGKTTRQLMGDIRNIAGPNGDYVVVPAPFGNIREVDPQGPTQVKDPNGKLLGTLHKLVIDGGSGRIVCAVVRKADDNSLVPVPWADLTISQDRGEVVLTNRFLQLEPPESPKSLLDRSPKMEDLNRLIQELQASLPPDIKGEDHKGEGQRRAQQTAQNQQRANQQADCPDPQSIKGSVIRGNVVDAQENFLIIKDQSGTLVHVHKDRCTRAASQRVRSQAFLPGDQVEAYVTQNGNAISLEMLRPATYASFPDN